MLIVELVMLRL